MAEAQNAKVQEQDINQLLKVRREKFKDLQDRGKDPFVITKYDVTHHSMEIKDKFEELEGKTVTIAGRMMSKRVMGKASFCHVQDIQGTMQSYVARDSVGEEVYADFKKFDVGDIVGIEGECTVAVDINKAGDDALLAVVHISFLGAVGVNTGDLAAVHLDLSGHELIGDPNFLTLNNHRIYPLISVICLQNRPYGGRCGECPGRRWSKPGCSPARPCRRSPHRPGDGCPCRSFCTSGQSGG